MKTEDKHTCTSCGNELSGAMESCPVCTLRKALAGGVESGESWCADTLQLPPKEATQRFEHYELVTGEDGKPVFLDRKLARRPPARKKGGALRYKLHESVWYPLSENCTFEA